MAERQGLELRKSRRRDVNATGYGGYWLAAGSDRESEVVVPDGVAGEVGFSLKEVEAFLTDPKRRKRRGSSKAASPHAVGARQNE
jgi:hypothetical protein